MAPPEKQKQLNQQGFTERGGDGRWKRAWAGRCLEQSGRCFESLNDLNGEKDDGSLRSCRVGLV